MSISSSLCAASGAAGLGWVRVVVISLVAMAAVADHAQAGNDNTDVLATFKQKSDAINSCGADVDVAVERLSALTTTLANTVADAVRQPAAKVADLDLTELEEELKAAAEADEGDNPFDMRGTIGRRWTKALKDPAFKAAYSDVGKVYAKQQAFRAAWSKKEWALTIESKLQKDTVADKDFDGGSYKPLAFIAKQQGSDAAGVRATSTYATNCLKFFSEGI